jgi:hypothetical protein
LPGCAHAAVIEAAAITVATTIVEPTARNLTIDLHSWEYRPIQRTSGGFVSRTRGSLQPKQEIPCRMAWLMFGSDGVLRPRARGDRGARSPVPGSNVRTFLGADFTGVAKP